MHLTLDKFIDSFHHIFINSKYRLRLELNFIIRCYDFVTMSLKHFSTKVLKNFLKSEKSEKSEKRRKKRVKSEK